MRICFYIDDLILKDFGISVNDIPSNLNSYIKEFTFYHGLFNWLLRTHLELANIGYDSDFISFLPANNKDCIIVTHPSAVSVSVAKRLNDFFVVCAKADWKEPDFSNNSKSK